MQALSHPHHHVSRSGESYELKVIVGLVGMSFVFCVLWLLIISALYQILVRFTF